MLYAILAEDMPGTLARRLEARGFYAEALALALAPGVAPHVRQHIEARHRP